MDPNRWTNSLWFLFASSAAGLAQWATALFIARLLGYKVAGDYALALAIINPVLLFAQLQLRPIHVADAAGRHRFNDVLTLRIWMVLLASMVVVQFGTLTSVTLPLLLGLLAWKAVDAVADIYHGAFQKAGRVDWVAQAVITRSALFIALVLGSAWSGQALGWGVAASAVGSFLILLWFDRAQGNALAAGEGSARLGWPPPWTAYRSLFAGGFPLGVATMLISLTASLPRFALERFSGRESLGLFATTAALAQALPLVINALGQASSVGLARNAHEGDFGAFRAELGRVLFVGVSVVIVALSLHRLLGASLLAVFLSNGTGAEDRLMMLQLVSAGLSGLAGVFGFGLTALGEFRQQLVLFIPLTILCMILSWLWIPSRGPEGAALVYLAVSGTQLVCAYLMLQFRLERYERGREPAAELE